MSFDVSALSDYTEENRLPLIASLVKEAKSATILEIQTGFKYKGAINIMDTDVVFQSDESCGFNASGTTTLEQRILTVGAIKIQEQLCPKDLNKKWTMHLVKAGSKDDAIPFEQEYTQLKAKKIALANETAIWQGDTDSATVNLKRFDGLLKIIDAEATVIDGNTSSATAITAANVLGLIDDVYKVMPTEVIAEPDSAIFAGWDTFRTYVLALKDANMFHYAADSSAGEIVIPGTDKKLIALEGLTGTDRIIAARTSNLVIGVDLENEEEDFKMWYSEDDMVVKFTANYKMGTQVKFPEEIVEFTLTA